MLENAEKADAIIGEIADLGIEAAELGEVRGRRDPEGWSELGKRLRALAQASPAACEQLAQAWERGASKAEKGYAHDLAGSAAAQAYVAADYARHEGAFPQAVSGYGGYGRYPRVSNRHAWMPDFKAVCEVTQEYDDEGEMRDCASIVFMDKSEKPREGRDAWIIQGLDHLARHGLNARHEASWSAGEIYEQTHESWGLGTWGDTTNLARAAEQAKVVFEERMLSRQTPQVPKTKAARI